MRLILLGEIFSEGSFVSTGRLLRLIISLVSLFSVATSSPTCLLNLISRGFKMCSRNSVCQKQGKTGKRESGCNGPICKQPRNLPCFQLCQNNVGKKQMMMPHLLCQVHQLPSLMVTKLLKIPSHHHLCVC